MTICVPKPAGKRFFVAALTLSLSSLPAFCARKPPVQWTLKPPEGAIKIGSRFSVTLHGTIEPGWHLYALQEPDGGPVPTEISLAENGPIRLLRVDQSKPQIVADPVFQVPTSFFTGNVDFTLHLQSTPAAKRGSRTVHLMVRYQSCNDRMCLPPRTDTINFGLTLSR